MSRNFSGCEVYTYRVVLEVIYTATSTVGTIYFGPYYSASSAKGQLTQQVSRLKGYSSAIKDTSGRVERSKLKWETVGDDSDS